MKYMKPFNPPTSSQVTDYSLPDYSTPQIEEFEVGDYVKYKLNPNETDNIYKITKIMKSRKLIDDNARFCTMTNIIQDNEVWEQLKYLRKLTKLEMDLIKYNL